ncbi:tRNA-splicing endonuclease subunit sen54 N-term-domain-containing protein [Boletus edulis]|nr:tRNA-splicing endonuclease subunit sen54 N-term-domain-containing protein [Boletus edulis]
MTSPREMKMVDLDWTKLSLVPTARPIIPKRGEKDFEPAPGGGSGLQLHILDRSRDAMFEALRAKRTISSKTISYGIWYPSIDRVHVTTARGIHFSAMGYSISRTAQDNCQSPPSKLPKRLELLPEEALYLIERGALFCYKSFSGGASLVDSSKHESQSQGAPMSVQQSFAEMIGREDLTLERYQVYAYLKRLGFILMRAEPPTPEYPVAPPVSLPPAKPQTGTRRLSELFSCLVSKVMSVARLFHRINWWRRLQLHQQKTTRTSFICALLPALNSCVLQLEDIFKALRFIPCGHTIPLYRPAIKSEPTSESSSPYKVFFHAYKPSTPFRKTAPPAPDFYVVVVDARTTPIPSLQELTALFGILPEMPLPPPRKRGVLAPAKLPGDSQPADVRPSTPKTVPHERSPPGLTTSRQPSSWSSSLWTFFQRLLSFLPSFHSVPSQRATSTFTPRKPNPFLALKTGKKTIVIAAVDAGSISFFRFGQGVFEEWPMI